MTTDTCIGWRVIGDTDCPFWGGPYHGCTEPDGHTGTHHCPCGATYRGAPGRTPMKADQ